MNIKNKTSIHVRLIHFLKMIAAVRMPTIAKCCEVLGENEGNSLFKELLKAEFRSATFLKQQLIFLKNVRPNLTVRAITKLLEISNDKYYNSLKDKENRPENQVLPPSQRLLNDDEELEVIANIHINQMSNDCLDGKGIRLVASQIYHRKTGIEKVFSRDWFMDFKERHKEEIKKVTAESLEEERANISIESVNRYINEVEEMMLDPPNPFLLINLDEIGFGRRPQKGKRKSIYTFKECRFKPF